MDQNFTESNTKKKPWIDVQNQYKKQSKVVKNKSISLAAARETSNMSVDQ